MTSVVNIMYMCSGLSHIDHNCVPHCTHHSAFNVVVCVYMWLSLWFHYLHMYFVFPVHTGGAQVNTSLVLCLMMCLMCGSALIINQPFINK